MERNTPILFLLTGIVGLGLIAGGREARSENAKKPDFSGNWELNSGQSKFGRMTPPTRMTLQAAQKGSGLHSVQVTYDQEGGPNTVEGDWYLDGKEHAVGSDGKMVASSHWDGNTLVSERKSKDNSYQETIRLTLSSDGKSATEDIRLKDPNGSDKRTLVWNRK